MDEMVFWGSPSSFGVLHPANKGTLLVISHPKHVLTETSVKYSTMADRASCPSFRASKSHTQQWTPRRPLYTHNTWRKPKSSINKKDSRNKSHHVPNTTTTLLTPQCSIHNLDSNNHVFPAEETNASTTVGRWCSLIEWYCGAHLQQFRTSS